MVLTCGQRFGKVDIRELELAVVEESVERGLRDVAVRGERGAGGAREGVVAGERVTVGRDGVR